MFVKDVLVSVVVASSFHLHVSLFCSLLLLLWRRFHFYFCLSFYPLEMPCSLSQFVDDTCHTSFFCLTQSTSHLFFFQFPNQDSDGSVSVRGIAAVECHDYALCCGACRAEGRNCVDAHQFVSFSPRRLTSSFRVVVRNTKKRKRQFCYRVGQLLFGRCSLALFSKGANCVLSESRSSCLSSIRTAASYSLACDRLTCFPTSSVAIGVVHLLC